MQTAQTSLRIRQIRANRSLDVEGKLPRVLETPRGAFLTTTIFVKYNYRVVDLGGGRNNNELAEITVAALPNGMLQDLYNPQPADTIWLAGRDAPTLGEAFRVRLGFARLKAKATWRVQKIQMAPAPFVWDE